MNIETKWLDDFLSLARTQSFSRSAEERHMTQPAFSRRIKALEEAIGCELVDRATVPVQLTVAGQFFKVTARSLVSQLKLLRLLQEGEYYPLGSDRPKRIKARVIVATHQDLEQKQQTGEFRKDLFYRLRIHHVEIPALRHRKKDIPMLLDYFLNEAAQELKKRKPTIPKELLVLLDNYNFPGNVRELRALAYDAMSQHKAKILSMDSFRRALNITAIPDIDVPDRSLFKQDQPLPTLQEANDLLIEEAMRRSQDNQSIASRLLGISQPALSKRLKKKQSDKDID